MFRTTSWRTRFATVLAALTTTAVLFPAAPASADVGAVKARQIQERVDRYLAAIPDSRQVAPGRLAIPGGELTVGDTERQACRHGWLCTWKYDNGFDKINYYRCGTYPLPNWVGRGGFENSQTDNTYTAFKRADGSVVRASYAYDFYDDMDWTPVWHVLVC
ncbi:hypothetical protein P3102_22245 [Amycolatopsis sp. QT-25]|uniref:hypothetical protein n=1 Tax=Amycolatopsis sp. QT-25 TaxID=3034022 RepID=UPI0023EC8F72|nr:hypothetical protein [Amycolatopsis sp. QT-25]WET76827.1 hypothetical protein P3102_22245 [Amycolatopsis sp. QT-25]